MLSTTLINPFDIIATTQTINVFVIYLTETILNTRMNEINEEINILPLGITCFPRQSQILLTFRISELTNKTMPETTMNIIYLFFIDQFQFCIRVKKQVYNF